MRALTSDLSWAAALMEERRTEYETYEPVFWRAKAGVRDAHAAFLGSQLAKDDTVAVRVDDGFAIAIPLDGQYYVDDFAVEGGRWADVGGELLREVWTQAQEHGASALRIVTARLDRPKVTLLDTLGLRLWQQWWVRALAPVGAQQWQGVVEGAGFRVLCTPAPPVYDPGGPVGLVQDFNGDVLQAAISAAESAGLVLLIVPLDEGDPRTDALNGAGFHVASQYFIGTPSP